MANPKLMFYTDARHPLTYMYEPPMYKEEFESTVDELVGTPVEALMFCLGDGRTMQHDTKVGEIWGHNVEMWEHHIFKRAYDNVESLMNTGLDPLSIACNRAREKNILFYPTLLLQLESGVRGGPGYDVRSSDFRLNNKRFDIGANGDLESGFPGNNCADFKHLEVRNERLSIVNEVASNYPIDGFDLQFNFWPYYFRPDEVKSNTNLLTDFVRDVHETVKRSSSKREIVVTIPSSLEDCLSRGLDVVGWVREGIVDVIVAQPIKRPDVIDPNASYIVYDPAYLNDIKELCESVKNTDTRVNATLAGTLDSDRNGHAPIDMIRAAACSIWDQGVNGLYIDWFASWPYNSSFYNKIREVVHPDIMASKDKFYHVPTSTRSDTEGKLTNHLPIDLVPKVPVKINIYISDDLGHWHSVNRLHDVLLRIRITGATETDSFTFKLNGTALPKTSMRIINQMYGMDSPRYRIFGQWYVFRLDKKYYPIKGVNSIEVISENRDADLEVKLTLRDVEIDTKYLLGASFGKGFVDPDLGPYTYETT
jgi:hypothetical protein